MSDNNKPRTVSAFSVSITQEVTRSPEYRSFYAGNFRFQITALDATLTFIHHADKPGGTSVLQEEGALVTTHAALKVLSEHLVGIIEVIEREFGPIRVPAHSQFGEAQKVGLSQLLKQNPLV
jgi:hypothetical protein